LRGSEMVKFITSEKLSELPRIKHGFFTRLGGVSGGIYAQLNCGTRSDDERASIIQNRLLARKCLAKEATLVEIHQTHSDKVHIFDGDSGVVQADAIVTDQKNIALSVVTADCAPILFADEVAAVIGAVHAGWQGAQTGIIENTISAMCELGATPKNITAAIGPCIAQKSYEVGPEFFERINNDIYFLQSKKKNHYLFDLESYVSDLIRQRKVSKIDALGVDTYPEINDFFSYRRKSHLGEKDYGRQISIILQH